MKPDNYKLTVREAVDSLINGRLLFTTNPLLGKNIITAAKVGVSGDGMTRIWRAALKKIRPWLTANRQTLILGLGAGSAAKLVRKYWPQTNIIGVEIDPAIIALGKKYFSLDQARTEIVIADAFTYQPDRRFDLILVDLFVGNQVPKKFQSRPFLKRLFQSVTDNGAVIFNRIFSINQKPQPTGFATKLASVFPDVRSLFFRNNLLLICRKTISFSA